ncbi:isoprenylcysteine carboxylmethyltransferase family protein [Thalassotalea sp. 1_MG-2023]|uniref:methyltransferase family protein n=1 Tax=Thalassotalea sp. 1_MG-2023 TaxID=3062680 RepID=UPI0026E158D2|nr:isoprenylcysteine carboxylmethyltransferase family protein [Thalassotalea sp. 1_MG-2023]MDO6426072.1 isoprenylcysteine carboxylmethyltransferase family protein [Thalassotalea sp. 1_MG-2023]
MKFLELKIPPLLLMCFFAVIMWLSKDISTPIILSSQLTIIMTLVFLFAGLFVIVAGVVAFKKANTTVDPTKPQSSATLVDSGIYRVTRNPMYLGFSCWLMALCFYTANPILIGFVVLFVLYLEQFQITPEERALEQLFGQPYLDYCQQVRRWI